MERAPPPMAAADSGWEGDGGGGKSAEVEKVARGKGVETDWTKLPLLDNEMANDSFPPHTFSK